MNLDSLIQKPDTARSWSPYQDHIFSHLTTNLESLIIQAVAGSGKTTTIVEAVNRVIGTSIFLAFNKSIASELSARISRATVKTLNALGHSIVTSKMKGIQLDSYKSTNALRGAVDDKVFRELSYPFSRLISLAKALGYGLDGTPPAAAQFDALMDAFEIYCDKPDALSSLAAQAFPQLINDTSVMDFDDQLYYPAFHDLKAPRYNNVFVDEAQDLSIIQHHLLHRITHGRVIAVGDRAQAIYQFRGADEESMDKLKKSLNATELPLSICYRCPRSVIEYAQTLVPWIEPSPTAIEGSVTTSREPGDNTTLVICRSNAPLFSLALARLKERKPTRLLTSWADQVPRWLRGFKAVRANDLAKQIDLWCDKERAIAEERGWSNRIQQIEDRRAALVPFCAEFKLAAEVLATVEKLLTATDGLTLSTIHKAKGLESPHVFILSPRLLESQRNLHYVAVTRAQESLTFQEEL